MDPNALSTSDYKNHVERQCKKCADGSHLVAFLAQKARGITVELTRRRESQHLRRTKQVAKYAPAAHVQRFAIGAITETNSTRPSLFAFAATKHDRGALRR